MFNYFKLRCTDPLKYTGFKVMFLSPIATRHLREVSAWQGLRTGFNPVLTNLKHTFTYSSS